MLHSNISDLTRAYRFMEPIRRMRIHFRPNVRAKHVCKAAQREKTPDSRGFAIVFHLTPRPYDMRRGRKSITILWFDFAL